MHKILFNKACLFFTLLVTILLFASCITARKTNYLQEPSVNIPKYNDSVGYKEYLLSEGDKLYIRVYSTDTKTNALFNGSTQMMGMGGNMSGSGSDYMDLYIYSIKKDGTIKLPIVGDLHLEGQTVREAKKTVEKAIEPLFKQCAVDLKITGRTFSVIGGSLNGKYTIYREKMNIFQALAMAGDISTFGDRAKIRVIRESPEGTQIKVFDVRSKDIINSEFYYIEPNDVIYIENVKEQFFSVTSFTTAMSTVLSTISFGFFIYNLIAPAPASN